MSRREFALAVSLILAASMLTHGVALAYRPAGWIVAGLATAGLAVLFLTEVGE